MPHNWTRPGTSDPCDPPVITTNGSGDLVVQLDGMYAALATDGLSIVWVVDESALVPHGTDAYPALDLLFDGS